NVHYVSNSRHLGKTPCLAIWHLLWVMIRAGAGRLGASWRKTNNRGLERAPGKSTRESDPHRRHATSDRWTHVGAQARELHISVTVWRPLYLPRDGLAARPGPDAVTSRLGCRARPGSS